MFDDIYSISNIQQRNFKSGSQSKQLQIKRKDGERIDVANVRQMFDELVHDHNIPSEQISIIGLTEQGWTTIVSHSADDVFNFDDEEYLQNKPEYFINMMTSFISIMIVVRR